MGSTTKRRSRSADLPVSDLIVGHYQFRSTTTNGDILALAKSIQSTGIIEPIIVRQTDKDFEVVAGERRLNAAQLVGLRTVPCIVRTCTEEEALEIALVENLQREDLNPVDYARGIEALASGHGLSQQQIADRLGLAQSTVSHYLRILSLPPAIVGHMRSGRLSMGHAKVLLSVDENRREELARLCVLREWTVRGLERVVSQTHTNGKKVSNVKKDPTDVIEFVHRRFVFRLVPKGRTACFEIQCLDGLDVGSTARIIAERFGFDSYKFGGWVRE